MTAIRTTTLGCGATLVTERLAGVRSVGVTWLLPGGTARDPSDRLGLSALCAEYVLRGAGELDSRGHADAADRLGASRATGVETFSWSIRSTLLGERLSEAAGLLVSMVRAPRFEASQLEPVRSLCVQAIDALADDPGERAGLLVRSKHASEPTNRSPYGERGGLTSLTLGEVSCLFAERATPSGSVLALAGDVEHDEAARLFDGLLSGWSGEPPALAAGAGGERGYHHEEDETEQVHLAIAHDAPPETSEDAWHERVATAVLSGGMSGRLFSEVREKRSLVYSVQAGYGAEASYGRSVATAGTTPERAQETLDVTLAVLRGLGVEGTGELGGVVREDEFRRAVVGLKSRLVFSGESSSARASALAHDVRKLGRARSLDEMAASIDGVTLGGLNAYLARREPGRATVATVGPRRLEVR